MSHVDKATKRKRTHYRGVYRGPGFVPAFFRLRGTRQRCILCIPAHEWKFRVLENPVDWERFGIGLGGLGMQEGT